MKHFCRALLGALFFACSVSVFALVPPSGVYSVSFGSGSGSGSSPSAACSDAVGAAQQMFTTANGWFGIRTQLEADGSQYGACGIYGSPGSASATERRVGGGGVAFAPGSCPANSTASGSACLCTPPAVESADHSSCDAADPLKDFCQQHAQAHNTFKMTGSSPAGNGIPASSCYVPDPPFPDSPTKGCSASIGNAVAVPGDSGNITWSGTGSFDGSTCESSPPPPDKPKASDDDCQSGFKGTVNGVSKCIPAEPDKGIDGVKSSSATDSNGVKTDTKEVTQCQGANCTTTTTTTTTTPGSGGGAPTVTTTTKSQTQDITDKCKADPTNQVCQKTQGGIGGKVSDGNCDANASATGCGGGVADIGNLYTKKDKTVAQVFAKGRTDLDQSQLGSAVGAFFTVSEGGSCPHSSASIAFFRTTYSIDAWCSDMAASMFLMVRVVLLLCAGFLAFKVAIDN